MIRNTKLKLKEKEKKEHRNYLNMSITKYYNIFINTLCLLYITD